MLTTTHLLQPLDLGVFAKVHGEASLKGTAGAHVTKELFPGLIPKLWETSFEPALKSMY